MKTYIALIPVAALLGWGCESGDTIVSSSDTREQIHVVDTSTIFGSTEVQESP